MDGYKIKSYLWVLIVGLFLLISLVGCSSAPKVSRLSSDQYCYTKQTIETENKETVNSRTVLNCSDDPVDQYVPAKMGLAKDCYVTYIPINRAGRLIQEKIYVCQKHNGSYDVVEPVRVQ